MKTLGKIILRNAIPPFSAFPVLLLIIYLFPKLGVFQYILTMAVVLLSFEYIFKELVFKKRWVVTFKLQIYQMNYYIKNKIVRLKGWNRHVRNSR